MECDVAVLGGGPGGYTAAIRAAQLGAKTVCIEQGARARRHLPARRLHPDEGLGADRVRAQGGGGDLREARRQGRRAELDFGAANEWKDGVVKQMTQGVASLFKANGVEWVKGTRPLHGREHDRGRGRRGRHLQAARSSRPARSRCARRSTGIDSPRCVDSTGLLAQTEVPRRLVVLGGGIIGCEFASIFQRFGSEVTIVEMLAAADPAGGRGRGRRSSRSSSASAGSRSTSSQRATGSRTTGGGLHRPLRRRRDASRPT